MNNFHVNSSLPRSGSELMQCLLSQNPQIYASATSPLLEYWFGAYGNYNLPEVKSQPHTLMEPAFINFCKFGTEGYYSSLTNKSVVVDKSRGWLEYAELLWRVFPSAKIICMTRDLQGILKSLDKIYSSNPGHPETRHLPRDRDARYAAWAAKGAYPLGMALERINNRLAKGDDPRILYIKYEHLIDEPIEIMLKVQEFLGVDPIKIDPNNIVKLTPEDDSHYGIFGNHKIKSKITR